MKKKSAVKKSPAKKKTAKKTVAKRGRPAKAQRKPAVAKPARKATRAKREPKVIEVRIASEQIVEMQKYLASCFEGISAKITEYLNEALIREEEHSVDVPASLNGRAKKAETVPT